MKAILTSFLFSLFVIEAVACTCSFTNELKKEYVERDFIIIGKVLSSEWIEDESSAFFKVEIEVREVFKSDRVKAGEIVSIRTGQSAPACGYRFKKGSTYTIYANETDGHFKTDQCTRTTLKWRDERKKLRSLLGTD